MQRSTYMLFGAAAMLAGASSASAWEMRVRFVERVGNTDVVLPGNIIDFRLNPVNIRVQVGVFDNAAGAAPAGGVYGVLDVGVVNNELRGQRTPGRLPAFSFPAGGNGEPAADPFITLTDIDATVGPQTLAWNCANGVPGPMPSVLVRGVNTYVSVMQFTLSPRRLVCQEPMLTVSGQFIAASSWSAMGSPTPPVCQPPTPGSVTYAANTLAPIPFSAMLRFAVGNPGPGPFPPYYFCIADWNRDQALTSADFFEYLEDFFAGDADANCDRVTNSADFFLFLTEFLDNCGK